MPIRGERIKELRTKRGLSQRKLAEKCALGENQIFRMENNKGDPTAESLVRVADYLGVSADYLLGRVDEPTAIVPAISPRLRRILDSLAEFDEPEIEAIFRAFHTLKGARPANELFK